MKKLGLLSLMFLFILSACRKDSITTTDTISTPDPTIIEKYDPIVKNVTASVIGFIVDENDMPVSNAAVELGNNNLTTDEYGHFFLNDITMNSRGAIVRVKKDGFFDGSRRFFPKENTTNRVKIQLLKKSFNQSFSATDGGTISLSSGASIDFDENSIQTASGDAFTGTVEVAVKWMDPSALATLDQMPGNLQGVNDRSQEVVLATFGMMAVELQDENGASLNIADDATAQLTMPVPANMRANAPAEIPLWSYYEDLGVWVEESSATLQNGNYVGEVSHFSFWNCDAPYPLIEFTLTVVDSDGNPVTNALINIEATNLGGTVGSGQTGEDGSLSGLIPSDQDLVLTIFDHCDNPLLTQNIGPFDTNVDLGAIIVTGLTVNNTTITGSLECNGDPVTNGLVAISFDQIVIYHYPTSNPFSYSFTTCDNTTAIEVLGVDIDETSQSDPISATPGTINDLGNIQACEEALMDYLRINVDGEEAIYFNPTFSLGATQSSIEVSDSIANGQFQLFIFFGWRGIVPGDYSGTTNNFTEIFLDSSRNWAFNPNNDGFTTFNVLEIGAVGEEVIGNFTFEALSGENVSGDFNIIRQ